MKRLIVSVVLMAIGLPALAETRAVYLETEDKTRVKIATLKVAPDQSYSLDMETAPFSDHFLSMRPFKCLEGSDKHWCHVPYPYDIRRSIAADLTDLEYDFLFLWKGATEYGINMWNGLYYKLEATTAGSMVGTLHEMDMDLLSAPPEAGNLRPLRAQDLHLADPESHVFPRMIIE